MDILRKDIMGWRQPAQETLPLLCSKAAAGCGVLSSSWVWIGQNSDQIAAICTIICTLVAVISLVKSKAKKAIDDVKYKVKKARDK